MDVLDGKVGYEAELNNWVNQEKSAVALLNSVGSLMYNNGVELVFFRNHLVDINVTEMLQLFDYSKNVVHDNIDVHTTALVAKELLDMNLAPSKIDIEQTRQFQAL